MLHSCNHILVPIDFTEVSKAAVSLALMLAESSDSCTVHLTTSDVHLEKDFKDGGSLPTRGLRSQVP